MKLRLLGLVLMVSLLLTPALSSAAMSPTSPMDGLYVATNGFINPMPNTGIDMAGLELGIGGPTEESSIDWGVGVYLPSAANLSLYTPVVDPGSGFAFTKVSDAGVNFTGQYGSYTLAGNLWFSNLTPDYGFMNLFLNVTAISIDSILNIGVFMEKQTHTPIPGAVLLLGTGLVGLVGLRKKFQA